jgi:hypothetical protein
VEVKPTRESASELFLHVLIASDVGQSLPQVKLGSRDGQTAVVEIAGASNKATLQFRATGQTGGHVTIVQDGRTTVDDPLPAEVVLSE